MYYLSHQVTEVYQQAVNEKLKEQIKLFLYIYIFVQFAVGLFYFPECSFFIN